MQTIQPLAVAAAVILSNLGCAARPRTDVVAYAPRAEVEITSSPNTSVLIYGGAPAIFALKGEVLRMRSDTIRTTTPVRLEAYLDAGEIHLVADGGVPLKVTTTIANAPATQAGAAGHHIILNSGGVGIQSLR
jgi:hypothetical protein